MSENGHHTYSATLKGLLLKIATNMMTADRIAMIENRALASKSLFSEHGLYMIITIWCIKTNDKLHCIAKNSNETYALFLPYSIARQSFRREGFLSTLTAG